MLSVSVPGMLNIKLGSPPHLTVPFGLVQFSPLSTGSACMAYVSGSLPVPLLQDPLQGPDTSHVALHATGLHGFQLVQGSTLLRRSPCLAGHSVPFLAAGVVMTYLQGAAQNKCSNNVSSCVVCRCQRPQGSPCHRPCTEHNLMHERICL